jgi:hypothetical protein
MSVIFGLDYERLTVHCFNGEPPHARRDMSVEARHYFETTRCSDCDSIETWRDMSVIIGVIFFRMSHFLTATRLKRGGI